VCALREPKQPPESKADITPSPEATKPAPLLSPSRLLGEFKQALTALLPAIPDGCCIRVVDGDTNQVQRQGKQETVRLLGVDTAEMNEACPAVRRFAEESTWFTERVALYQQLRMDIQQSPKDRDRSARLLAFAYREDGALINQMIIREGFGFAYLKYPFDSQMMDQLRNEERDARENKRGLWGPVTRKILELSIPKDEPRAQGRIGIGDSLRTTNPAMSSQWYQRVVDEFPKSTSAPIARNRLKLPEPAPEKPKPLTWRSV
jgi:micrococcal nuclease